MMEVDLNYVEFDPGKPGQTARLENRVGMYKGAAWRLA